MQQRSNILYYETHSWIGVLFSILLFVIAFSGVVALFDHEITQWERPAHRIALDPEQSVDVDRLLAPVLKKADIDGNGFMMISLPDYHEPTLSVRWKDAESGNVKIRHVNPNTGEVIPERSRDFAELLRRMHTDLLLPQPYGRYLIGVMGLLMLLSLLSGIVIHKKIFREMFRFRTQRSKRLLWTDMHKALGVWPLPFHIVLIFTGAILGLNGLMLKVTAVSAFEGDVEAAVASVLGERAAMSGEPLQAGSYNQMLAQYREQMPEATPRLLMVEAYGDHNQVVQVSGITDGALVRFLDVKYRSRDGEVVHVNNPIAESGPLVRTYFSITPLHYALYGGFLIKALYFVLGMALCMMMATGTVIWQLRKSQRHKEGEQGAGIGLALLTAGVCTGMAVATAATFYANKLLPMGGAFQDRYFWVGCVYFAVWIAAILWALVCGKVSKALRDLLTATGVLLAGIPLLNAVTTGNGLLLGWEATTLPVAMVDLGGLLLGVACLFSARAIPVPEADKEEPQQAVALEGR